MRIRKATLEDAAAISHLIVPLAEKYIAHEFSQEGCENLLAAMTSEAIHRYMTAGICYHVGEVDDEIVGVVGFRDKSHLYHLFVAESAEGMGYARRLWQAGAAASRREADIDEFTVNSSTFAADMYKKFGFTQTGPLATDKGVSSIPMKMRWLDGRSDKS